MVAEKKPELVLKDFEIDLPVCGPGGHVFMDHAELGKLRSITIRAGVDESGIAGRGWPGEVRHGVVRI